MADPKTVSPSDDGDPIGDPEPIEIGRAWRTAAAAIGALGLGFGGWAVFVTRLEAGPVALLAIGLVFAMIAMAGVVPWKIKFGETEIQLRRAKRKIEVLQNALEDVASTADPSEVQPLLERLDDSAPDVSEAMRAARSYEQLVIAALRAIARAAGGDFLDAVQVRTELERERHIAFQRAGLFDGLLRNTDHSLAAAVEIRASLKGLSGRVVDGLVDRFRSNRSATGAKRLLLIVQSEPTEALRHLLDQYSDVTCVVFTGSEDERRLTTQVRQLIRPPL